MKTYNSIIQLIHVPKTITRETITDDCNEAIVWLSHNNEGSGYICGVVLGCDL